jgi:hypothetical protein
MTKNIIDLKNELKELAAEIKVAKKERKSKYFTGTERVYKSSWADDHIAAQIAVFNMRFEYRIKHVAYCMLRGRHYEEIENNVKPYNTINMNRVKKYMVEYGDKENE